MVSVRAKGGYGFEILQAVVRDIRETLPELDIVALIERENRASIALFEKLGFSGSAARRASRLTCMSSTQETRRAFDLPFRKSRKR